MLYIRSICNVAHSEGARVDKNFKEEVYKVVKNHEEQYSIWFAHEVPPQGWEEVGQEGSKDDCLSYIEKVWVDMRPLSLRNALK